MTIREHAVTRSPVSVRGTSRTPTARLVVAFVAVVASFIGATIYTQGASRRTDAAVASIVKNTSPSIQYLAAARGEMRHIEHLLKHYIDARETGAAAAREPLESSRATLEAELTRYFALEATGEERELAGQVRASLPRIDKLLTEAIREADAGRYEPARKLQAEGVRSEINASIRATMTLIEMNARDGHELAAQALSWRKQTESIAILLDVLCVLIAAAAVLAVFRAQQKHTKLLTTHAEILESRADELESFAARVAHDILSPLSGVKMALTLAARKTHGEADVRATLERGERSLTRVTQIVDGLLDFARAGATSDPSVSVAVAPVLQGVVEETKTDADAARIELRLEPFTPTTAACSAGVLASLTSNLVRNAIKYMGNAPERRITIRLTETRERVRLEVADTGPGLPPQLEPTVFEPYVRAPGLKENGMGLGLATVKRLAEGHGGVVGVRSTVGRGCVFWFELPKGSPATAPSSAVVSQGAA